MATGTRQRPQPPPRPSPALLPPPPFAIDERGARALVSGVVDAGAHVADLTASETDADEDRAAELDRPAEERLGIISPAKPWTLVRSEPSQANATDALQILGRVT